MINNDWDNHLSNVWSDIKFQKFYSHILQEYENKTIYPSKENIFNALKLTSYANTKVVIVGQDPYHGENQANGLSFSVPQKEKLPPSLKNIFKELTTDLHIATCNNGDLTCWAKEGVLLLNTVLTVEKDRPASHKDLGWEILTDNIIKELNKKDTPVVFILWGNFAKEKSKLITSPKHLIITSAHPSPLSASRGFFGSKPFSQCNEFLINSGQTPINWEIK